MAAAIMKGFHHIDVTASARTLKVPTLVLHVRRDARVPAEEGRRTASLIPGARLVALDGSNHILQAGEPALDQFLDAMSAFLAESRPTTSPRTLSPGALTQREKDVLELIARGADNATIARQLFLSPSTVRNHITRIFAKIHVQTRAEAIVLARRSGFGQG
jgi:DNA-binding NarL/FixJ family response regulator